MLRRLLLLAPCALLALSARDAAAACSPDAVTPAACFSEVALSASAPRSPALPGMPVGLAVCAMIALALPPLRRADHGELRLELEPPPL